MFRKRLRTVLLNLADRLDAKSTYFHTTHSQISIIVRGKEILVDEGLASIIFDLNMQGIETSYSCQGGTEELNEEDPSGYIVFSSKTMTIATRNLVEKLLGFDSPLPVYVLDPNGWLGVEPAYPFWEYWPKQNAGWTIRFGNLLKEN